MLRILYRFIPHFTTQYFEVVEVSVGPPGMVLVMGIPKAVTDLDPSKPAVRMKYFILFGWPICISRESRPPLTQ